MLPPGDVRQCLVALSEHTDVVRQLMSYRFEEGKLRGHSFGNIFLAALEKVSDTFASGVEIASEILKVKGRVIPVTQAKAELVITFENKEVLHGENSINHGVLQNKDLSLKKFTYGYKNKVVLSKQAKKAISEADTIVLGPGNYFCSVLPCLYVSGMTKALRDTKAKLIFPVNLTNKHGHTMGFGVAEYVEYIENVLKRKIDVVLINNEAPSKRQIKEYQLQEGDGVMVIDNYKGKNAIRTALLSHEIIKKNAHDKGSSLRSFIRHSSALLAKAIIAISRK